MLGGNRVRLLGPVLAIEAVTADDAGSYKCSASNGGGEASAELRLAVTAPLHVDVAPNVLSVHMAGTAEFRCVVTSNGAPPGPHDITWYKDGRQLPNANIGDTLLVRGVGREDKGMYQCVVRRREGDTFQATAELQLGGKWGTAVMRRLYNGSSVNIIRFYPRPVRRKPNVPHSRLFATASRHVRTAPTVEFNLPRRLRPHRRRGVAGSASNLRQISRASSHHTSRRSSCSPPNLKARTPRAAPKCAP